MVLLFLDIMLMILKDLVSLNLMKKGKLFLSKKNQQILNQIMQLLVFISMINML